MRQHHLPSVWRDPAPLAQFCSQCGAQVDAPSLQARPRQKVALAQILERHGAQGFAERPPAACGQLRTGNAAVYEV